MSLRLSTWILRGVLFLGALPYRPARAQPAPPIPQAARNYLQSGYTRVRPQSLLRANGKEAHTPTLALQTPLALALSGEAQKHYARIAELDVLLELAGKEKAVALEERIDATARREMSRYFRRLQILRAEAVLQERARL